jgi:hypothetical protein
MNDVAPTLHLHLTHVTIPRINQQHRRRNYQFALFLGFRRFLTWARKMQTGNASGPWRGRYEFSNPGTQLFLPNSSSPLSRAYSSYQGVYNESLQNHEGSYYVAQS